MTQPSLLDAADAPAPTSLPYRGGAVETCLAGRLAADHAAVRRPRLAHRYLDLLLRKGAEGATDHEAAAALGCPVSSLCSTRAGAIVRDQITTHGHRRGPYGELNAVHVLRIILDQTLTRRET